MRFFVALTCIFFGTSAFAQNCAPRDRIVDRLAERYAESKIVDGKAGQQIFELFFSPEHRTWTVILTDAKAISCVMATGTNMELAFPPVPQEQKPDL